MAKFHIGKNGDPAVCKATLKGCPLGSDTPHGEFESKQAALAWAESYHAQQAGGSFAAPANKNKSSKPKKLFIIAGHKMPLSEPGVPLEETGWVTAEMLTPEGRIEDKYLDDNYGFPRVFGEIKFSKNSDGTYALTGPKRAIATWMEEDDEDIKEYELGKYAEDFPKEPKDAINFFADHLEFTDGDEDLGYFREDGAGIRVNDAGELQVWKSEWPADSETHEWLTVGDGQDAFDELK